MACDTIICDWNGTLIEYRDEKPILESIATDLFKASIPFHPFRMVRILKARGELEILYREEHREAEFDFVREMFKIYNRRIISGLPASFIYRSVDRFARRQQTQAKLDHRVLRPIKECHQGGKTTGIFSAGYKYGIERILTAAGYKEHFDFCEADHLKEEGGRAVGFELNIYKNKPRLLLGLLQDRNMDESRVAYVGDSENDEGCFEIVRYPVVAFLAPEELKERYAQKYKAFVPRDEKELASYFRHA
jgi:phosphoglycolate phosphatase-like HAD superfamily hydrolase